MPAANKLTQEGRVTIPVGVRRKLKLKAGDSVRFVVSNDGVRVERGPDAAPLEQEIAELEQWLNDVAGTANLGGLTVDQWLDEGRDREHP